MKYSVKSLLNGIAAYKTVQQGLRSRSVQELQAKFDTATQEYWDGLVGLACQMSDVVDQLKRGQYSAPEAHEALSQLVTKIYRANRFSNVNRAKRDLDEAQHELTNLQAGTKTEFELWLMSLQDDGVTEITTNGIKTAGFDERTVTKYFITARKLDEEATRDSAPITS